LLAYGESKAELFIGLNPSSATNIIRTLFLHVSWLTPVLTKKRKEKNYLAVAKLPMVIWKQAILEPLMQCRSKPPHTIVQPYLQGGANVDTHLIHCSLDPSNPLPQPASRSSPLFFQNLQSLSTDGQTDRSQTERINTELCRYQQDPMCNAAQ